jgi:hypothetical protein
MEKSVDGSGCRVSSLTSGVISIFAWQQNRGRAPVSFRNDPDFSSAVEGVRGEQPKPMNETEFVLAAVVFVYVSPVSLEFRLGDDEIAPATVSVHFFVTKYADPGFGTYDAGAGESPN